MYKDFTTCFALNVFRDFESRTVLLHMKSQVVFICIPITTNLTLEGLNDRMNCSVLVKLKLTVVPFTAHFTMEIALVEVPFLMKH
jgi:hypothetical protein